MFNPEIITVPSLGVLASVLFAAILIERRTGRIPNGLNLLGIVAGLVLAGIDGMWASHLSGLIVGFLLGTLFYALGGAGAGYAKLLAAVGSVTGPVIPVTTTVVFAATMAWFLVRARSNVSLKQEDTVTPAAPVLIHGSLIVSAGTVVGLVLLIGPWM